MGLAASYDREESMGAGGRNAGVGVRRHAAAIGLDLKEWIGRQKAVSPHLLAAHHALEQARERPESILWNRLTGVSESQTSRR